MIGKSTRSLSSVLALAGAALNLAAMQPAAADTDVTKEVATAATHAGLAAKSTDMKTVQMHLHHTINCLVGPKGRGFDPTNANPCKDLGAGAIPDTKDAAMKKTLRQALRQANAGLRTTDMATAQKDAAAAQALLAKPAS